ncbi:MAG: hypothetical protein GY794_13670, partial [bacterium]|nr:hypothetical protein [bacterium]
NALLVERTRSEREFTVYLDPATQAVRIVVGDQERVLKVGEWSDWVPVDFEMIPTHKLHAMCRFLLKGVVPEFELYATLLNFDPLAMDATISTPEELAAELAEGGGRYYTQGMPEDTAAYSAKVFETHEFLEQASLTGNEFIEQYDRILEDYDRGLLFYYFGNQDQVAHMMWRAMDPNHPGYVPERDEPYKNVISDRYQEYDKLVGRTLDRIDDDTLLVVMSDHGFTSWRRGFDLNAWLRREGYLTLRPGKEKGGPLFVDVDWLRTRAYGLGINGLYINLVGREKTGIVMPHAYAGLVQEIREKLLAEIDPKSERHAITKVYLRDEVYPDTRFPDIAPDLVVGYAKMTRGSGKAALGEVGTQVMFDNLDQWSGSHLMDHEAVPGVLLTSRPLKKKADKLENLAAAILAEFGIEEFPAARENE